MDTSKQYIKRCDCPEIQDLWKPKVGDRTDKGVVWNFELDETEFALRKPYGAYILEHNDPWARSSGEFYTLKDLVYLPTIGKLMGMFFWHSSEAAEWPWQAIRRFYKWSLDEYSHEYGETSMEQLWLAFVMHELHNKKWVDEEQAWM